MHKQLMAGMVLINIIVSMTASMAVLGNENKHCLEALSELAPYTEFLREKWMLKSESKITRKWVVKIGKKASYATCVTETSEDMRLEAWKKYVAKFNLNGLILYERESGVL